MVRVAEHAVQAVNIALLVITTGFAALRMALPWYMGRRFVAKDAWLAAAWVFYITLVALYISLVPAIYRVFSLHDPTIVKDAESIIRVMFATAMLLWLTLWSVKFSLLALYTQLLRRAQPIHKRIWWGIVIFASTTLLMSVLSLVFACGDKPSQMFVVGKCLRRSDQKGSAMSLWLSYAADALTDIMILMFPIFMVGNLSMPLKQKISVVGVFALGLVCVVTATIRVFEVGKTINAVAVPDLSWLALWSVVEGSIAIIVGCAAGFFELVRRSSRTASSTQGSRSQWYTTSSTRRTAPHGSLDCDDDDGSSSQVELTSPVQAPGEILKTTSTSIAHIKEDYDVRTTTATAMYFEPHVAVRPMGHRFST